MAKVTAQRAVPAAQIMLPTGSAASETETDWGKAAACPARTAETAAAGIFAVTGAGVRFSRE